MKNSWENKSFLYYLHLRRNKVKQNKNKKIQAEKEEVAEKQ
jgi:hypothetical protein